MGSFFMLSICLFIFQIIGCFLMLIGFLPFTTTGIQKRQVYIRMVKMAGAKKFLSLNNLGILKGLYSFNTNV